MKGYLTSIHYFGPILKAFLDQFAVVMSISHDCLYRDGERPFDRAFAIQKECAFLFYEACGNCLDSNSIQFTIGASGVEHTVRDRG